MNTEFGFFFKKSYLKICSLISERGGGGEREKDWFERETPSSSNPPPIHTPTRDSTCNPYMHPDWDSTQPTEPWWPGLTSLSLLKIFFLIYWFERETETLICYSTHWGTHWLILVCVLTGDWTHNLGILGQYSNLLSFPASAGFSFEEIHRKAIRNVHNLKNEKIKSCPKVKPSWFSWFQQYYLMGILVIGVN